MWLDACLISSPQRKMFSNPGCGKVHSIFPKVVNISRDGLITSLADLDIGDIPNGILVNLKNGRNFQQLGIKQGMLISCDSQVVNICDANININISTAKEFNSKKRLTHAILQHWDLNQRLNEIIDLILPRIPESGLAILWNYINDLFCRQAIVPNKALSTLQQVGYSICQELIVGIRHSERSSILHAVGRLSGLGVGLTPSGDDILTGFLASANLINKVTQNGFIEITVLDEIVSTTRDCTNPLAWTYLHYARKGEIGSKLGAFISILLTQTPYSFNQVIKDLFSVGATSGSELALGAFLGAKLWSEICHD